MAESSGINGIRINDAQIDISASGLESLLNRGGAEVTVRKIDLSVSPEALNTLLRKATPPDSTPPQVTAESGRLLLEAERDGKQHRLDLQLGSLKVEIGAEGIRLSSTPEGA